MARLMPMSGPVRPGSYDFAFHAWFDRLGAVGFFPPPTAIPKKTPRCAAGQAR